MGTWAVLLDFWRSCCCIVYIVDCYRASEDSLMSLGVIDERSGFLHHKKHLGPSDDNSQDFSGSIPGSLRQHHRGSSLPSGPETRSYIYSLGEPKDNLESARNDKMWRKIRKKKEGEKSSWDLQPSPFFAATSNGDWRQSDQTNHFQYVNTSYVQSDPSKHSTSVGQNAMSCLSIITGKLFSIPTYIFTFQAQY